LLNFLTYIFSHKRIIWDEKGDFADQNSLKVKILDN